MYMYVYQELTIMLLMMMVYTVSGNHGVQFRVFAFNIDDLLHEVKRTYA